MQALESAKVLAQRFRIKFPVIQAPMAGGPSTPSLTAAVSNSGGLGSIAGAYLSPAKLRADIQETRAKTSNPFAVNLFTPLEELPFSSEQVARASQLLNSFRKELGMALDPPIPSTYSEKVSEQLQVVLEEKPNVFSFTFGIPPRSFLEECRERKIITVGTATNVEEALALEAAGVDMVTAQGYEAGGHRGTFIGSFEDGRIGLLSLIPQIVQSVNIPVIAAGGIMNGKGIAAALAMGASGASLGTAFLLCPESGTNTAYRQALRGDRAWKTEITHVFSGREARGIRNRFMEEMKQHVQQIPPYPIQNALTRELRSVGAKAGNPEVLSLWCGQGARLIRDMPAGDLVQSLITETVVVFS